MTKLAWHFLVLICFAPALFGILLNPYNALNLSSVGLLAICALKLINIDDNNKRKKNRSGS